MIEIKNLSKAYERQIIADLSFAFPDKGLVLIRGESGSGKTTLFRILLGLTPPDSGTVTGLENKKLSPLFQEDRFLPWESLWNNLLLVRTRKTQDLALLETLLRRFGLWEHRKKKPAELSGGMKERGAIVRSLYYGGDVYLWDEPTKELDE